MGRNLAQSPLQIRSSSISPATKRHSPHSPLPLRQGFKATVESPTSVLQNHWSVDLEAAAAAAAANCTAAHRVTGAYDPSQDSAVAAQCSRIRAAFPSHGLLLALSLVVTLWVLTISSPELSAAWTLVVLCMALGLLLQAKHRLAKERRARLKMCVSPRVSSRRDEDAGGLQEK